METVHFACCDLAGAVVAVAHCAEADLAHWPAPAGGVLVVLSAAEAAEVGLAPLHWRAALGVLVLREVMDIALSAASIAADGVDTAVLSGLPDPCEVTIAGAVAWGPGEVTGGTLTLTSTLAGRINLRVASAPRYRPWSGSIDAH